MAKKRLCVLILLFLLTGFAFAQESRNLGSSKDWLSIGPIKHVGPYYISNSDLPMSTQRFLVNYPSYPLIYYPIYYPTYDMYYPQIYYPYYYPYNYFDSFPFGTFSLKHGGYLHR